VLIVGTALIGGSTGLLQTRLDELKARISERLATEDVDAQGSLRPLAQYERSPLTFPSSQRWTSNAGRTSCCTNAAKNIIRCGVVKTDLSSPEPCNNNMTANDITELAKLFVLQTLLTFVLAPFVVLCACLAINAINFCDELRSEAGYPHDLWDMLWVTVPASALWSILVALA
jgi:hypothetical protein